MTYTMTPQILPKVIGTDLHSYTMWEMSDLRIAASLQLLLQKKPKNYIL